jgi:hypothetical protein
MNEQTSKETLLRQVDGLRGQARKARRLAETLTRGEDMAAFLTMAAEFDQKADVIEKQAAHAKTGVLKRFPNG